MPAAVMQGTTIPSRVLVLVGLIGLSLSSRPKKTARRPLCEAECEQSCTTCSLWSAIALARKSLSAYENLVFIPRAEIPASNSRPYDSGQQFCEQF